MNGPCPGLVRRARRCRRSAGFTIVELMIAVLVVGLLMTVALPSFMDSLRKGRRSDAFTAISAVQQAQERVRGSWLEYCGTIGIATGSAACGLGLQATSSKGHYLLELSEISQTGYVVTATATGGQAADTRCGVLVARMEGGKLTYGSGSSSSVDWTDRNRCWPK